MSTKDSSHLDWLLARIEQRGDAPAVAVGDQVWTYAELARSYHDWRERLIAAGVAGGEVVSVEGGYGLASIGALLAGASLGCILVPLSSDSRTQHDRFRQLASVGWRLRCFGREPTAEPTSIQADHPIYQQLRDAGHPGLVLFTSGSTGESKAAVHDFTLLLEKFEKPRQQLRTIVFLQLDHIGGINTLLYTLANGGMVVVTEDRSPAAVCRAIASHRVELLPTSPTFLNLLLLSEEYTRCNLSSLRLITYGTEPMPESTLQRMNEVFPHLQLQQTYGLTELGILRSQSRDTRSLWVRVGGEGFETKIVEGRLWIRARSAMLGYLNAPSPFDSEGFFDTGDRVEVDGEWLRILGRQSEIINVGGSKVYPSEVESVLLEMDGVLDATVRGEAHALTGQVVLATVQLAGEERPREFRARMRQHCLGRLPTYAVPVRVEFSMEPLHNARYKRMRRLGAGVKESGNV
jgi:long-chain acyl-CoA synthetase